MISAIAWVKKGAAQRLPDKAAVSESDYNAIIKEHMADQVSIARKNYKLAVDEEKDGMDTTDGNKSAVNETNIDENEDEDAKIARIYGIGDDFDEEDEDEEGETNIPVFGKTRNLAYFPSNNDDPYIQIKDEQDEAEEMEELEILPTDNLIVACKTEMEDDGGPGVSHLEVYLYEEEADNLYVHHDIMLPSFPLCIEWMDFRVGRRALPDYVDKNPESNGKGNYVAIGTFDPEIEIWDLDTVESVFPELILGAASSEPETSAAPVKLGKKGKKKKTQPKRRDPHRHTDAVTGLSWNQTNRNLLLSCSADTTVKLWDLSAATSSLSSSTDYTTSIPAMRSFTHHNNKVAAVAWNQREPAAFLSGGYDRQVCAVDTRMDGTGVAATWKVTADVECIRWDPLRTERFLVSTEDGLVTCFDARNGGGAKPVYTIHAHDSAVSALDVSGLIDGLIVTGSTDKMVKLWDTRGDKPKAIVSRDVHAGKIFSTNFSTDSPTSLAIAGSNGKVVIWNLQDNSAFRRAFAKNSSAVAPEPPKEESARPELVVADSEDEDDDDDKDIHDIGAAGDGDDIEEDDEVEDMDEDV